MAKYQLLLPKMGESVAEATIIKWLKKPGDYIDADDAVVEIATDKVDSEVPSPVSGTLLEWQCAEDDVIEVGKVIAIIETGEAETAAPASAVNDNPAPVTANESVVIETVQPAEEERSIAQEEVKDPEPVPTAQIPVNENIPGTEQLAARPEVNTEEF
jgi:2-oxoglutarate dehydrogenase E2 component (dihydrolipoamide succinyltransferase)